MKIKTLLFAVGAGVALLAWLRTKARLGRLERVTGAWRVAEPNDCCTVVHLPDELDDAALNELVDEWRATLGMDGSGGRAA